MVASSVLSRWSLSIGALALAGSFSACQQSENGGAAGDRGGAGPTGGGAGAGALGGSPVASGGNAGSGGVPASGGAGGAAGAEVGGAGGTPVVVDAGADRAESGGSVAAGPDAAADSGAAVSGLPGKSAVLDALRNANAYFVAKWPDPTIDIVTDKARPSNLWTRAVYYEGLMGLYAVEPDMARRTSYYNYAVTWAATPSRPWQANTTTTAVDANFQACGQTYIDLYRIDQQPIRIANIQANIDSMVSGRITNAWTWVDAIQMSMPVFAKLGALLGNTGYFDAMWALYSDARNTEGGGMYNAATGLWWRDLNFTPDAPTYTRSPNGQDIYWSRGNGWLMAALARVLDAIPSTEAHRAQYVADFRALAAALVPLQRTDGFWNESLTNPMHCQSVGKTGQDGPETSGTALFTYGLAFGIRTGLLDAPTYGPVLARAWNGLVTTALHTNGFLGWVQSTGAAPCEAADMTGLGANVTPNFEDYGLGAFLLGGSEVYKLAP